MPPNSYTVADVARRFGVSLHTVGAWIKSGELKAVNVARSRRAKRPSWRIPAESIAEFEAARTTTPKAERSRRRKPGADVIAFY